MSSQAQEGRSTKLSELLILFAVLSAQSVRQVSAQLDERGQGLGISAQNVTEINMEETTVFGEHEVVVVPVPHPEDVSDDAVARQTSNIVIENLGGHPKGSIRVTVVFAKVVKNTSFFSKDLKKKRISYSKKMLYTPYNYFSSPCLSVIFIYKLFIYNTNNLNRISYSISCIKNLVP